MIRTGWTLGKLRKPRELHCATLVVQILRIVNVSTKLSAQRKRAIWGRAAARSWLVALPPGIPVLGGLVEWCVLAGDMYRWAS